MIKAPIKWGTRVTRALLAGIACAVLALFFNLFAMGANVTLGRIAGVAIAPGGLAEHWIFGPQTGDVHYHEGGRFAVFLIGSSLFYALLIFLLPMVLKQLSSARSEQRRANGE